MAWIDNYFEWGDFDDALPGDDDWGDMQGNTDRPGLDVLLSKEWHAFDDELWSEELQKMNL